MFGLNNSTRNLARIFFHYSQQFKLVAAFISVGSSISFLIAKYSKNLSPKENVIEKTENEFSPFFKDSFHLNIPLTYMFIYVYVAKHSISIVTVNMNVQCMDVH